MTFDINHSLALACERSERDGVRQCLEAGARRFPEFGIETVDLHCGMLAFAGVDSPLSEARAFGIEAKVSPRDVETLTTFYRERGCVPRVTTGPLSDPELGALLARSGYVPFQFESTLVASIDMLEGEHDERIIETGDPLAWGDASARAFTEGEEPSEMMRMTATLLALKPNVALEARENGEVVATACYGFQEKTGIAAFFAGSTAPGHRRKGWHRAMLRERVARAREAGMRVVRADAEPLSDSERNFRKLGFVPLYTRVLWEWRS